MNGLNIYFLKKRDLISVSNHTAIDKTGHHFKLTTTDVTVYTLNTNSVEMQCYVITCRYSGDQIKVFKINLTISC
jgi:hypothetical protein